MKRLIENDWDFILENEFKSEYYSKLRLFLANEYRTKIIYPAATNIFNALKLTPPERVKAVILGQDPYINPGQAHGLAFSVLDGVEPPPSLKNVFKELYNDMGDKPFITNPQMKNGNLTNWAKQGILLLNTVLTVEAGKSNSHAGKGWETFTDAVIKFLGVRTQPTVFILWGRPAAAKTVHITNPAHMILKAPHPSPLSASGGFFGCRHFSKANEFLASSGIGEIDWSL